MPTPPNPTPDFTTLAAHALMCCQQWRAWAKRQPANHPHIKHAYELAQLLERHRHRRLSETGRAASDLSFGAHASTRSDRALE